MPGCIVRTTVEVVSHFALQLLAASFEGCGPAQRRMDNLRFLLSCQARMHVRLVRRESKRPLTTVGFEKAMSAAR